VRIVLRAGSGFAREPLMAWCEADRVDDVLGLARNSRLIGEIAAELAAAAAEAGRTGKSARCCKDFRHQTVDSWGRERRVVGKAEQLVGGSGEPSGSARSRGGMSAQLTGPNPRFVVTSLGPDASAARPLYERLYRARGEIENRMYGRLPPRKRCLRRSGMVRSAAVMYPASHAATWLRASMRSAAGSRLSSRARRSVVLSGSADPGLTGHAIVSKITLAARGNSRPLRFSGQARPAGPSQASSCPGITPTDHAGAR
jgi:Transposase DDE domain group 1